MKNNFVFPIITSVIVTVVGLLLEFFGFDFKALLTNASNFQNYKELVFVTVGFLFISGVVLHEIASFRYEKKLKGHNELLKRNKDLEEQLVQARSNLKASREAVDELMQLNPELKIGRALSNYKKDNQ